MRTTLNLEPEAYRIARAIAAQRHQSLGKTISEAIVERFRPPNPAPSDFEVDDQGWPVLRIGRVITPEEVAEAIAED